MLLDHGFSSIGDKKTAKIRIYYCILGKRQLAGSICNANFSDSPLASGCGRLASHDRSTAVQNLHDAQSAAFLTNSPGHQLTGSPGHLALLTSLCSHLAKNHAGLLRQRASETARQTFAITKENQR